MKLSLHFICNEHIYWISKVWQIIEQGALTFYYEYTFVLYLGVVKELLHRKMCMAAPGARCYDDFLLLYYENSVHRNMYWIQVIGNKCM